MNFKFPELRNFEVELNSMNGVINNAEQLLLNARCCIPVVPGTTELVLGWEKCSSGFRITCGGKPLIEQPVKIRIEKIKEIPGLMKKAEAEMVAAFGEEQ